MNKKTAYITCCAILICFIGPHAGLCSEMTRGEDGVWRNTSSHPNAIVTPDPQNPDAEASVSNEGLTLANDEVTKQCESHYRNDIRKTTACVLRSSNISVDKDILRNCTKPWDHDLNKALSCYSSAVGLSRDDQAVTSIQFGDESLDLVQKGLKRCINGHQTGSPGYNECFDHWGKKKGRNVARISSHIKILVNSGV